MTSKLVGERREHTELAVIPPSISREEAGTGRVGAVAYPYRVYEAKVTIERPFMSERTDRFVASVDRSRRLVVRADGVPDAEEMEIEDVLVLPTELSPEQSRAKARESVLQWTLRRYSLNDAPKIEFVRDVDAYKLFWLVERPEGDGIVDSVRGTEDPLRE
ncbi:hypothetical protein SAMN05421858_2295 [Haladaptatus litoreus]|uniref:Uncharacterized protein n=1 Tax=Haladaptatus litoreus TaxID=553468 RepID=A0A1N7B1N2_9EURY|nr:hypothetical protein [Haladaptatus litoreus]SIR45231.1 hypothetical protein SAMN05421858_2295 [Haladaptatus litoreus]